MNYAEFEKKIDEVYGSLTKEQIIEKFSKYKYRNSDNDIDVTIKIIPTEEESDAST